jgi:two-component system sensor histidine kinase PilS (NtrC family)
MPSPKPCSIAPVTPHEGKRLEKQLIRILFFRVLLVTIILGGMVLFYPKNYIIFPLVPLHYIAFFIVAIYIFTISSAAATPKVPCIKLFAYVQISLDILLTSIIIIFTGGSQSILIIVYFFPITCGALLLFRTGALFMAAQASLLYLAILTLEYQHIFPWMFPNTNLQDVTYVLNRFSIPGLIFFLVAFIGAFMAERLYKAELELSKTTLDRDRFAILYKQIFDDITTGIITVDDQNAITSLNSAAHRISGYSEEEARGLTLKNFMPELMEEKTGEIRPIASINRKDGVKIPVGYSWSRLNMPGDTGNYRIYTMQDLSEIKRMEFQIRQAEKMAAIGRMAAGIAHEFRNPLAAMSGAAQLLAQEIGSDTTTQALMNIIIRESDRLEETIREFLLYSRPSEPVMSWFSIKGLTNDALSMVERDPDWNNEIKLDVTIGETLDCWGDANQIRQILINLLINASQAMEDTTKPRIAIQAKEALNEQGFITLLSITDNGPGIKKKNKTNIFDPFFTTRESGTGLGLSIVSQIIEAHEGELVTRDATPKGTVFQISFPYPRELATKSYKSQDGIDKEPTG